MVLHELDPLIEAAPASQEALTESIRRCNRYFGALEHSFGVMVDGMDRGEARKRAADDWFAQQLNR